MTGWIWLTLAGVALAVMAAALNHLPPRRAAAVAVAGAALGMTAARQFALALPMAFVAYSLWRSGQSFAGPAPNQTSEVKSDGLAMVLDHDSGEMDGEVLIGPFTGRNLSQLAGDELQALVRQFDEEGDEDSLSLLLAYLDRRQTRQEAAGEAPPPDPGAAMSPAEAYRILGLEPGASTEEIRAAHHRLIRKVHPDLGGSSALAAMINAAKETLDPG